MTNLTMFYADYNKQNQVNQTSTNFKPEAQQTEKQFGTNPNANFKQPSGKSLFSNPKNYEVAPNNNAKYNFKGSADMESNTNYGYMFSGNTFNFGNFNNVSPQQQSLQDNVLIDEPIAAPLSPPEKVGGNMQVTYTGDPHLNAFIDKNVDGKFDESESIGKIDNIERGPQQLLGDKDINLVANQVPWGDGSATVVGSTDLALGANKFLFNPDGSVSLNGKPFALPTEGWTDGTNKIKINGTAYDVTTPEYKINILNNGDHQNITAQTTADGINADSTKPVGVFGDVFANESIKPLQDLDTDKDGFIKNGEGAKYANNQQPLEDVAIDEPVNKPFNNNFNTQAPQTQSFQGQQSFNPQAQSKSGSSGGTDTSLIMQLLTQLISMLGVKPNSMNQNSDEPINKPFSKNFNTQAPQAQNFSEPQSLNRQAQSNSKSSGGTDTSLIMQLLTQLISMLGMKPNSVNQNSDEPVDKPFSKNFNTQAPQAQNFSEPQSLNRQAQSNGGSSGGTDMSLIIKLLTQLISMLVMKPNLMNQKSADQNQNKQGGQQYYYNNMS